ncbi:MAG TPA: (d)CMP kinase [Chloroflexota bacterium]
MPVAATIALDGPAGAGKTVVGMGVARQLGYLFLDTGAMYRALTYLALQRGVALTDETALVALARQAAIDILPDGAADGRPYTVLAAGEDVTWQIRNPPVNENVSTLSAWPGVRREMVRAQVGLAARGCCVLAGRDIGTVVLPQADLKVFLVASLEERARRRAEELRSRGEEVDLAALRAAIAARDELDSRREASPLKPAPDAHMLDSTGLTVEEVVATIVALARKGLN